MSNSNTPPKPNQPVVPVDTIPPGSNLNSTGNKPSLTVCTESYKPQKYNTPQKLDQKIVVNKIE